MALQRFENYVVILLAIACLAASSFSAFPGGYQGQVSFNGFAVPGVTVTATQGTTKKFVAVTDDQPAHLHFLTSRTEHGRFKG